MYKHDAKVWDSSIVQGAIFCRPVPNFSVTIRNFCIAVRRCCTCMPFFPVAFTHSRQWVCNVHHSFEVQMIRRLVQ
jgi:hypothetical protein